MPSEEQMKSAIRTGMDGINQTSTMSTSILRSVQFNEWLIALALLLVVILSVVIVMQCRRQRNSLIRSNRAYGIKRGLNLGQNNDDDEDDLLISSLYS